VKCGDCCRQPWEVDVEGESLKRWPERFRRFVRASERRSSAATQVRYVIGPKGESGSCPFLDSDNLCTIHKELGYEAKPLACRRFPFRFISTPRGVVIDVSFVCNEIMWGRGVPIEELDLDFAGLLGSDRQLVSIPERILLKSKTSITYDAYLLIEEKLLQILRQPGPSIEDRLVGGNIFLFSLCKNIYDDERIVLDEANIRRRLERFKPRHFSKLFQIAKKSGRMTSKHKQQMFVITFITFASDVFQPHGRLRALLRTLANNIKQSFNVGRITVPVVPGRIRLRRLADVKFDVSERQIGQLAARYMSHCVFRKTMVGEYGLFRGYNLLLLLYGVAKWLSRVFALQSGRLKVEAEDFAEAIRVVERRYVRHTEFPGFLRTGSRAMRFVDRLFSDLGFAPIVVKS